MEKYTIYCTSEQTRKALELGAPIEKDWIPEFLFNNEYFSLKNPTAEQMISWFEEQGFIIEVSFRGLDEPNKQGNKVFIYHLFDYSEWEELNPLSDLYKSRKEATLAAIDAALKYLCENDLIKQIYG